MKKTHLPKNGNIRKCLVEEDDEVLMLVSPGSLIPIKFREIRKYQLRSTSSNDKAAEKWTTNKQDENIEEQALLANCKYKDIHLTFE